MSEIGHRYFLLHKQPDKANYVRNFPPLENNIFIKIIIGSILERCVVEGREHDIELFLNYLLVLRTRF